MIRRVFQVFSHGRVSLVHAQSSKFIIHLWRKSGPQTLAREFPSSRQNGCQRVKNHTFERSQHENAFPNQNFKFKFACFMRNLTGLAQLVLSLLVPFKGLVILFRTSLFVQKFFGRTILFVWYLWYIKENLLCKRSSYDLYTLVVLKLWRE